MERPRSPEDQEWTGIGTPRSADDGLQQPGAASEADGDPAVVTGMTSGSHPASADEVTVNRSGSGGSGGPVEGSRDEEGSGGESLSEMLTGEEE